MEKIEVPYAIYNNKATSATEKQQAFHDDEAKVRLFSGAFRAGKTIAGCNEAIRMCLQNPCIVGAICRTTHIELRRSTRKTFFEAVQRYEKTLSEKLNKNVSLGDISFGNSEGIAGFRKHEHEYKFSNGSHILFINLNDPQKLGSIELGFFYIDEATQATKAQYNMLIGRLSQIGMPNRAWMTTNPDSKFHWLYKLMKAKKVSVTNVTTYDNPYLPSDYIRTLEEQYDEDIRLRYLEGQWGSFEGRIYKTFTHENVQEFKYKNEWEKYIGVDMGIVNETAILDVYHDIKSNIIYVHDEFYKSGITSDDVLDLLKKKGKNITIIDPSAKDMIERCKKIGIKAQGGKNAVDEGIRTVKSFLNKKLIVHPRCENLIKEFTTYRMKETADTPVKENDHALDALRYVCMHIVHNKKKNISSLCKAFKAF